MTPVSDPSILAQLNGGAPQGLTPVTDPALLAHLEGGAPQYQASDDMSEAQRLLAMYGRGVAELGQGVKQLGLHGAGAVGLADPKTVSDYDKQVADEAKLYEKDLGQRAGGSVLPAVAQMVTTLPVGGIEAFAGKGVVKQALNTAMQGAAAGAAQPVTEGDYASQKAGQIGMGAGVGGATNLGLRTLGGAVENMLPSNLTAKTLNYFNKGANESPIAKEGEALAAATGVNMTPAQISGSKAMTQAENAARQSFYSRDLAAQGDKTRIQQLSDYFGKTMDGIAGSNADALTTGTQVRAATQNILGQMEKTRSDAAARDFGAIRDMTKGAGIIDPANTHAALNDIVDQFGGIGTPGADAIAKFAQKQLGNVAPKGAQALTDADKAAMQYFGGKMDPGTIATIDKANPGFADRIAAQGAGGDGSPAMGDINKLMTLRSYLSKVAGGQAKISGDPVDRKVAAQLLGTIDNDIDATGDKLGGNIGAALKTANGNYRAMSQQIESVKASPLGKILGEDFTGALNSGQFNSIPAEAVTDRLLKLQPSQLSVVKGLLADQQPEALATLKRSVIQDAIEKAQQIPASSGANGPVLRPNVLVKNLGDADKLKALFEPHELSQIQAGLDVARRMSDTTGYNFSGTAGQSELLGVLNNPLGSLKRAANAGLAGAANFATAGMGAKQVAQLMTDANGRAALLQLKTLPPGSAKARQIMAQLAATYAAQPEQGQQPGEQ